MKNDVELLSPAGDLNSFYAAINNGANAVYLGLTDFNARIKADNFNEENIKAVVRYAHLFNVKVYVTVNTIIKNDEIERFINLISTCVDAKVDAYIVQDFGVANILKTHFSNIVMHASTQMGVHNLRGARVAEKLGFKRVILSREASLKDIKQIKENTNLEIEFFVQGALCVSFSGNCYMSSTISGLSGNRGKCQQYCRKQYFAINENENLTRGYHLSTRDLCLINELKNLYEAGVCSFKIEGRLKRPGYVATITSIYRHIIDNDFINANENIINALKTAFSRGNFNYQGYLYGDKKDIINDINQNHTGIKIGELKSYRLFKEGLYELEIYSSKKINEGDGLKFFDKQKEIFSLGVGNVIDKGNNIYKIFTKNNPKKAHLEIYLTLDKKDEDNLLSKKIKLNTDIKVIAKINKPLCIIATCRDVKVRVYGNALLEEARTCVTSEEEIIKQVSKTGDTSFEVKKVNLDIDHVFIPKSLINETRRKVFEKLENELVFAYEKNIKAEFLNENENEIDADFVSLGKIIAVNENIDLNYLDENFDGTIAFHFEHLNLKALEFINTQKQKYKYAKFALNLPIFMPSSDQNTLDKIIEKIDNDVYLIANNIYGLDYLSTHKVIAGFGLNINNDFAIILMKKLGVSQVLLSYEVNEKMALKHNDCYVYSLGYQPLMNFVHCPFIHLYNNECRHCKYNDKLIYQDELNKNFTIRRTKVVTCSFELINYRPINLCNVIDNKMFIDLRNINNVNKVINFINNQTPFKLDDEFKGLFFKSIA